MKSMRISVDEKDPGFARYAELVSDGYLVRVTLNGVLIPGIVTADEDAGEVLAHKVTPEGNLVSLGGTYVYERLRGDVKISVTRPNDTRVLH